MASIFTTADRDAVKAAIVTAAVEGVASVSVAGQSVTSRPLADLLKLLEVIESNLAGDATGMGWRMRQLVPPGCG